MTDDPTDRPTDDDPFAWHPEPDLVGYGDPATSRASMARLGERTWTAALDYLYGTAVTRAMGDPSPYAESRRQYYASDPAGAADGPGPAPSDPSPSERVIAEFTERVAGGLMNSQHPRQFGYFTPPPLPMSIMGELLAQVANQGVDVWHAGPRAAFVEEEVVRWLCDLVGYGPDGFGLLTSGGVMANFMGMALARDLHLGRVRGLDRPPRGSALEDARVYTSDQTHFSIARALDELGMPPETLVVLPSDDDFHLRGAAVAEAVARDRAAGRTPFAIAAVAGSTNTGSVDAIGELADVAAAEDLWLHVDAAYGGGARLSERDRDRVLDLERADSVTVDPHKWFFQAYDIGGLLVRDRRTLAAVFGGRAPEYYRGGESDVGRTDAPDDDHGDQLNFYKLSFEGTRRWRALKLWMSWKHLGTQRLRAPDRGERRSRRAPGQALRRSDRLRSRAGHAGVVGRVLSPSARWPRRGRDHGTGGARRPPGPTPGSARGLRRRLADDDPPPWRDLASGRDRQLPLDRGRHRSAAGDPPPVRVVSMRRQFRVVALATLAIVAGSVAGCSSVPILTSCRVSIAALPLGSTIQVGEPLPAGGPLLVGPADTDPKRTRFTIDSVGQATLDVVLRGDAIARIRRPYRRAHRRITGRGHRWPGRLRADHPGPDPGRRDPTHDGRRCRGPGRERSRLRELNPPQWRPWSRPPTCSSNFQATSASPRTNARKSQNVMTRQCRSVVAVTVAVRTRSLMRATSPK